MIRLFTKKRQAVTKGTEVELFGGEQRCRKERRNNQVEIITKGVASLNPDKRVKPSRLLPHLKNERHHQEKSIIHGRRLRCGFTWGGLRRGSVQREGQQQPC